MLISHKWLWFVRHLSSSLEGEVDILLSDPTVENHFVHTLMREGKRTVCLKIRMLTNL